MIARRQDKGWITRTDNDHPLAYMEAAMRNLCTLINHHIGNAPKVELVKRGNKTLVIPEGTPESRLGILINKFTRGKIENLPGAIREVLQKSNPRLHGFHESI